MFTQVKREYRPCLNKNINLAPKHNAGGLRENILDNLPLDLENKSQNESVITKFKFNKSLFNTLNPFTDEDKEIFGNELNRLNTLLIFKKINKNKNLFFNFYIIKKFFFLIFNYINFFFLLNIFFKIITI